MTAGAQDFNEPDSLRPKMDVPPPMPDGDEEGPRGPRPDENGAQGPDRPPMDERGHFDPKRYNEEIESFITRGANLTKDEAKAFFPLLRELKEKQRAIFKQQKKMDKSAFNDNAAAKEAITTFDERELEMKKLQQQYHQKFLEVLPATKVLKCIHAEERFNRGMMRGMGRPPKRDSLK